MKYAFHFVFLLAALIRCSIVAQEEKGEVVFWIAVSIVWSVAWRMTSSNKSQVTWGRYRE